MKKPITRILSGAAVILVAIQAVPVTRTNPPVETEVPAPTDVRSILRRSCYDCHSNETVWPWYSRIAPASWLVGRDVREGREALNFSTWNRLTARDQVKWARESREEILERKMPPWFYRLPHPEARLSPADVAALNAWSQAAVSSIPRNPDDQLEATPED